MLRVGLVCGLFTVLALTLVFLRTEQKRCARQCYALESKWIEMRQELWRTELQVARLRTPQRVHEKLDWFRVDVVRSEQRWPESAHETAFAYRFEIP